VSATDAGLASSLARRALEHPVISVIFDLDPAEFATAGARNTQISSLLDGGRRQLAELTLGHEDKIALEGDLTRIEAFLRGEYEPAGGHSLALYASAPAGLFETAELPDSHPAQITIGALPELEPLLPAREPATVAVALVNSRDARFFVRGRGRRPDEQADVTDGAVRGHHPGGAYPEMRYETAAQEVIEDHLRNAADQLHRLWQEEGFDRLVLAGPEEIVPRFAETLNGDLTRILEPGRLHLDASATSPQAVEDALVDLRASWRRQAQEEAVQKILATLDTPRGDGTAIGRIPTTEALAESQVATLVLGPAVVDQEAGVCPVCGRVSITVGGNCPVDLSDLVTVPSLRNALITATLREGGDVLVLTDYDDRPEPDAFEGVGALLRF
jgi:hypothetical protein